MFGGGSTPAGADRYKGVGVAGKDSGSPKSFRDPQYASLAGGVESKLGLPDGLLHSIITNGERSNADQVSSAGARTVAQIIPSTRDAILKQYGVDAYLSPENALEAAGLLLRDSLKRNGGDVERAVREYHGGTDPKNWGPINNAYAGRVLAGMQTVKLDGLAKSFDAWMAQNPATAPLNTKPAQQPSEIDGMVGAFDQWQGQQDPVSQIPGQTPGQPVPQQQPAPESSLMDKALGVGEAALSTVTGMTGGTVGAFGGLAKGLGGAILDGTYGTDQAVKAVQQAAGEGADMLTYHPRTQAGQEYAGAVGEVMQNLIPVAPVAGEFAALARQGKQAASPIVGATAGRVAAPVRQAAQQVSEAVSQIPTKAFGDGPEANVSLSKPTPGTLASGGAAGADMASQRIATAENLGFTGDKALTKGQATRDQQQLRFEGETAKGANGAAIRERFSSQNAQLARKLDEWFDDSGADSLDNVQTGNKVVDALTSMKAADKNKYRVLYKEADKAGELEAPVNLDNLVTYLNQVAPEASTAPLISTARRLAVSMGIAKEEGGQLVPVKRQQAPYSSLTNDVKPSEVVTIRKAETFRQAINRNTDLEPTNIRQASIIKGLVDEATEGQGGAAYKKARAAYKEVIDKYETRGVVADLLANRKKMHDPKVAAENVFDRVILRGSQEDVSYMAKLLRAGGEDGIQAWAELRGATFRHLKEQALANNSTDQAGNTIFSPAKFEAAVKKLDQNGRLEIVLGKKEAQGVRDLNDIAKQVLTVPPGAVNTSNTASVILAAITEAGISGSTIGLPVPIMTGLRVASMHLKDRRLQARIADALRQAQKAEQAAPAEAAPNRTLH